MVKCFFKKRIFCIFIIAIAFVALFAGCGSGGDNNKPQLTHSPEASFDSVITPVRNTSAEPIHTDITSSEPSETAVPTENVTSVPTVTPVPMPVYKKGETGTRMKSSGSLADTWAGYWKEPDRIILGSAQIEKENARMMTEAGLIDLEGLGDKVSADYVKKLTEKVLASAPTLPKYNKSAKKISESVYKSYCDNGNVSVGNSSVKITLGIVCDRANMRYLPTDDPLFSSDNLQYDKNQETELILGQPVVVYFASNDGKYYFTSSYNYTGWVNAEKIALTEDRALWLEFASPSSFVTFTSCLTSVSGKISDMGVILPLISSSDKSCDVFLPLRNSDGTLSKTTASVSKSDAHEGYLPYTMANYIIQACKYEGTMYGWGGLDNGIDCSGFICAVLRTFGFRTPRDTSDQKSVVGKAVDVRKASDKELLKLLDNATCPVAVYKSHHVMFYLGKNSSGKYVFIHAPSVGNPVRTATYSVPDEIEYVNYIGE